MLTQPSLISQKQPQQKSSAEITPATPLTSATSITQVIKS